MRARQEKLKLFILLSQAFGLLITLLCSFIGALYIFDGEWLYAFPISIVFVVSMYYLVVFFCKEKENRRKKGYPPIFYYLFGVYAIMSIILSFLVLHFYNVEINEKAEIQSNGMKKVEGIDLIYKTYDQQYDNFLTNLEADINAKVTTYINYPEKRIFISNTLNTSPYNLDNAFLNTIINSNSPTDEVSINMGYRRREFLKTKNNTLTQNRSNTIDSFDEFIAEQKNIIEGWDRFSIGKSLSDLDKRITEDYTALNDYLMKRTANNYKIGVETQNYLGETLMNKPFDLAAKHFGPMTLIVLVFFQILILLPYFLTRGKIFG